MSHLQALTRLASMTGSPAAVDRLREALSWFTEGFECPALVEASRVLGSSAG
jgi:hypothetical protein